MGILKNMPAAGAGVIGVILALFILAIIFLFYVNSRYHSLTRLVSGDMNRRPEFLRLAVNDFASAYEQYGQDTNTPAIISNAMSARLNGLLFCERFLNNAVSLFVTLGLFGTFLGLSLSVRSLTDLISYSNTSEWLSVLDSVGGGLMSALSGMGVAFYTSLVGVACSIILTILRVIFNPQTAREKLAVRLELWLDQTVAPTLATKKPKDEATLVRQMIDALQDASSAMEKTMQDASADYRSSLEENKQHLAAFDRTVEKFNDGVRDCGDVNYNLQGSVERMDICVRNLVSGLRELGGKVEKGREA